MKLINMKNIGGTVSVTLQQEADSVHNREQFLTVEITDAGGGAFFRINTEGWSFDTPEELVGQLTKIMERARPLVEGESN